MLPLLIYALLSAACFYVASASSLLEPIRNRMPDRVYQFLDCPFCSGFWYGLAWAIFLRLDVSAELAGDRWPTPIVVAIVSIITTPLLAEIALRNHISYRRAHYAYDHERQADADHDPADAASAR